MIALSIDEVAAIVGGDVVVPDGATGEVTVDGGRVRITVTRMDRYTKVRRFRFTPEDWRTLARSLRPVTISTGTRG